MSYDVQTSSSHHKDTTIFEICKAFSKKKVHFTRKMRCAILSLWMFREVYLASRQFHTLSCNNLLLQKASQSIGFAFLSFTAPNYSSISKGFAFSHVRRRVVTRGGFLFWHRGSQKARPVGMSTDGVPQGVMVYNLFGTLNKGGKIPKTSEGH